MPKSKYNPQHSKLSGNFSSIRFLLPYLWPQNEFSVRARVILSLVLLILAKLAAIGVPFLLKYAVDALSEPLPGEGIDAKNFAIVVPIGLLISYGLLRILSLAFKELQGAVFATVAERAIRRAGVQTFRHVHDLALRFHLDRRTGGLSRAIERGTKGIEYVLRMLLFNIVPTMVEILMVLRNS